MKYKCIYILLSFWMLSLCVHAQREATWWYFGHYSGLDFTDVLNGTSKYPKFPTEGGTRPLFTRQGSASIADKDGNFLFASDGTTVFGRDRKPMPNGTGLPGNEMNMQAGLAIPVPESDNLYYLVVPPYPKGSNTITYSVIDMTLNGGKGDIVSGKKNIALPLIPGMDPLYDINVNIAAVEHGDGVNYWLASRINNAIYTWLITKDGFSTPIQSPFGYDFGAVEVNHENGFTNFSPNGKWIFATYSWNITGDDSTRGKKFFLGKFNSETGIVSEGKEIREDQLGVLAGGYPLTLEFSPNSKYLYSTGTFKNPLGNIPSTNVTGIYRYELADFPNLTMIPVAWDQVTALEPGYKRLSFISRLRIAPDGKLYGFAGNLRDLWAVENPNQGGTSVTHISRTFFPTQPETGQGEFSDSFNTPIVGLPFFIASFFKLHPIVGTDAICFGSNANFSIEIKQPSSGIYRLSHIVWDFGDGVTISDNDFSNLVHSVSHKYMSPGKYTVTVTPYFELDGQPATEDVRVFEITVNPMPTVSADNQNICIGSSATLHADIESDPNIVARWHTQDGTFLFEGVDFNTGELNATTTYRLDALNNVTGCWASTYVTVTINPCLLQVNPHIRSRYK
ncbi:hypothetical protein M2451_003683 [Dysgonomonas sp. PFB1-18]|uniref:Ig-like domain-containing protein n=1 Tax=unclassified Dysgonomonas TaxID=2630389 RepID=UPI002473362A|nr:MULTISPECIES: PKD domain-containing protein [unclassified Dysgonomonas]MDH6310872.1 hypothetical protein [Dysgonomonas sp. PF1-14]MDH6340690.1 hypothetical protein [Dysgonomonas sp. PF1-16]MDH6382342.1 hypothetical protein [Dysgonomonas sp. PFB1-18]MDH6399692.1 hypothetical protein [Dysgonomonas sp. PF1-23]